MFDPYCELTLMKTRKAFLTDESHRIRFVFTPIHTSWLNQIEIASSDGFCGQGSAPAKEAEISKLCSQLA